MTLQNIDFPNLSIRRRSVSRVALILGAMVTGCGVLPSAVGAQPTCLDVPTLPGWVLRGVHGSDAWVVPTGTPGPFRALHTGGEDRDVGKILRIVSLGGAWAVETSKGVIYDAAAGATCPASVHVMPSVSNRLEKTAVTSSALPSDSVNAHSVDVAPPTPVLVDPVVLPPAPGNVVPAVAAPAASSSVRVGAADLTPIPLDRPSSAVEAQALHDQVDQLKSDLAEVRKQASAAAELASRTEAASAHAAADSDVKVLKDQLATLESQIEAAHALSTKKENVAPIVWEAHAGEELHTVFKRWCDAAGKGACEDVAWITTRRYPLQGSASFTGTFEDAVDAAIRALRKAPRPPIATLSSNHMLIVESSDDRGG